MTSIHRPHHMYAGSAIQFRDPFASTHTQHDRPRANWNPLAQITDFNRALTPPPDMTAHAPKPAYYQQERGHLQYNDYHQSQQPYRLPLARFNGASPPPLRNGGAASQPNSRPISPGQHPRQPIFNDPGARSRRASQAAVIAPTFQIPHSVNDSGGSLSELTAQITCLFWFESADILQLVDASHPPVPPPRLLSPDAKPTTGFRKWVTTILSTTLVAQNVVLLALLFIYRLKKLNPTVRGKPGSEYRLLTVALMLSNKFLDDNTYTNKTWAEVSGILVGEVHIMEVEFLSNMKYCLYTSAEDWASWQSLLGKFAAFFEQASKPHPAATLPSASSLPMPKALPSPPAAGQPSPPYGADVPRYGSGYNTVAQHGPTPAPSPLTALPQVSAGGTKGRKRSHEDHSAEPPAKRMASAFQSYTSPSTYASGPARNAQGQQVPRLTLPSLTIPPSSAPSLSHSHPLSQGQQLPPLNVPARAMAMVYPNSSAPVQAPHLPAPAGPSPQPLPQPHSQYQSRQHSPYPGSAAGSPSANMPASATSLQPPPQISPTYFLQQRNSPYRPVHNVSTLLYPPPSAALQQRPQNLEYHQMHYQPLGKPSQQRQSGHLPYVAQNVWLDGQGQQPMTPVSQWPSFSGSSRQAKPLRQH
ncbi:hypothetical protein B0A50_03625 [Salinomyces thailandicus]|uniref:Cyclin-like protein n=1 Tax=Salinomyces thailandicus TaxID=706561 RepID=A0A4U0U4P0_9PEZI|nr:hypothetical protein B0A50_03625 [Salinomyces thailandica]